jgi:hypothetical protein
VEDRKKHERLLREQSQSSPATPTVQTDGSAQTPPTASTQPVPSQPKAHSKARPSKPTAARKPRASSAAARRRSNAKPRTQPTPTPTATPTSDALPSASSSAAATPEFGLEPQAFVFHGAAASATPLPPLLSPALKTSALELKSLTHSDTKPKSTDDFAAAAHDPTTFEAGAADRSSALAGTFNRKMPSHLVSQICVESNA